MVDLDRLLQDLHAVLPRGSKVEATPGDSTLEDAHVLINGTPLRARWLALGTLSDARRAISTEPLPDLLVGPRLSRGARHLADEAGIGWVDESGAADITTDYLLIAREGHALSELRPIKPLGWTPAVQGVAEVLLTGARPTVEEVVVKTRVSPSTAASALRFLTDEGLLVAHALRGRGSGRALLDPVALLNAYADAVALVPAKFSQRVGTTWRDPLSGAIEAGETWGAMNIAWAVTGALTAAALAPMATQVSPMVIYLEAPSLAALTASAASAGLPPIEGGRLSVRPFPGTITRRLAQTLESGLVTVPWPRAYADLRPTGVRGEETAEHLAERMLYDN